jgi:hypothetical protein
MDSTGSAQPSLSEAQARTGDYEPITLVADIADG